MAKVKTDKEEILAKALLLFRKKGYTQTSMSDLATACEIPSSLFYYYFKGGKVKILEEGLRTVHQFFKKNVFSIAYQRDIPVEERLAQMTDITRKVFLKHEGGCIMANTVLEISQYQLDNEQSAGNKPAPELSFIPILKAFFEDYIQASAFILEEKYVPKVAREKAEQCVQDIEGGIMLMRLYQDEGYFLRALERSAKVLN